MTIKVRKVGNSVTLTIPKSFNVSPGAHLRPNSKMMAQLFIVRNTGIPLKGTGLKKTYTKKT